MSNRLPSKKNDRLPSKKQLEAMGSDFASSTLDELAKGYREIIGRNDVSYSSKGRPISEKQGRAHARRKLNRIYALAHDLGHYVGQPDECAQARQIIEFPALGKAAWRREKYERYPTDPRNIDAAELLKQLSTSTPTNYDLARRFCQRYGDKGPAVDQRLSDRLTDVGFRTHPKNVDDFLRVVLGMSVKKSYDSAAGPTLAQRAA